MSYGQDPYDPTRQFSSPQQYPPNQPQRGVGTGVYVDWTRYAIGTIMSALVVFGVGGIMTVIVNSIFRALPPEWFRLSGDWMLNGIMGAVMTFVASGLLALLIVGMPKGTANGFFIGLGALAMVSVTVLPILVQGNWSALGDSLIWGAMGISILLLLTYIATPPTVRYEYR
ncbi:hypothetical protein [Smaragdicoccus niigatensis]|uniref:hypothetical protein n=1 Tax=Smaragdicoccus niigatensis TaxID=359359 RepID=UPI00037B7FCC|nr:hypothetical protein [Smaragdicoccus niigatensis]